MASIQSRHRPGCGLGVSWAPFSKEGGCTCVPNHYVVVRRGKRNEKIPAGTSRKEAKKLLTRIQAQHDDGSYRAQKTIRFVRCTTRPSARSVPGRVGRKNSACRSAVRNVSPASSTEWHAPPIAVSRIVVTSPPWTIGPDEPGKQ